MPMRSANISVGSNQIALASNSSTAPQSYVTVFNMGGAGSGIIWVGDSQVSVASGVAIPSNNNSGNGTPIPVGGGSQLYGISNSGVQNVRIVEII